MQQLLPSLRKDRCRILVGCRNVRNPHRIPRFEQLQRSLRVNPENRILDVRIRRRIRSARHQFILGVDGLASTAHCRALHYHHVPRLRHRKIWLRRHDHPERLQVRIRLHLRLAMMIER